MNDFAPKQNGFHPMPVLTSEIYFRPTEFQHVQLGIGGSPTSQYQNGLNFALKDMMPTTGKPTNYAEFLEYAKRIKFTCTQETSLLPRTPYDLTVCGAQQSIIIELDPCINWQFCRGQHAMTTKLYYGKANSGLTHIYPRSGGNELEIDSPVTKEGCRAIFFNVFSRTKDEDPHMFNLHVEFLQDFDENGKPKKRLITIFDPDIKNEGGQPFP